MFLFLNVVLGFCVRLCVVCGFLLLEGKVVLRSLVVPISFVLCDSSPPPIESNQLALVRILVSALSRLRGTKHESISNHTLRAHKSRSSVGFCPDTSK